MKPTHLLLTACISIFLSGAGHLFGQNVGIGTAVPGNKLHVEANAAADGIRIDNIAANGDPILQFRVNGTSRITMGIDDSDADKFKIGTSAITTSTRMTLQTNGYFGIGTTAPTYHWHQLANRAGDYIAYIENTNATGSGLIGYVTGTYNGLGGATNNAGGLGNYGVHLPNTGNGWAMWGVSNSSDAIGVRGSIPTTGSWLGFGGYFSGGLAYANGIYNLSDARLKKDVRELQGALAQVTRLRGVTYRYNTEEYSQHLGQDDRTYIGLIAQEVEAVVPEAVADKLLTGTSGQTAGISANMDDVDRETVKVVDYVSLVPLLIEAIKEQQETIRRLESRVAELENN